MTRAVFAPLFIAVITCSGVAAAQRAPNQAAAQALFDEGRKLMNDGKYALACPKLAESQKLDPGAGTLINLAACYEKAGQTASAWATYKEAIPESDKSNRREWATKARQRAAALEPTLSKMIVSVPESARAAGLVVKRDGQDVGSGEWGTPIPVDPGAHTIEASAPGRKPWNSTAQVGKANDTVTVAIPLLEALPTATAPAAKPPETAPNPPHSPPPPPESESSGGSSQRTIGFVVGGVGIGGLAVGAIFGLQAMGGKNDAGPDCTSNFGSCNQKGIDAIDNAKTSATISTIGFIAGGALTAGGVALVLTAPKGSAGPIRVGLADRGLGLSVHGAFR